MGPYFLWEGLIESQYHIMTKSKYSFNNNFGLSEMSLCEMSREG